ncbi:MAG: T9SS type A sorting domain-containing protein [Chitinophagaceae bacterium]|nr:MAG: T9SS type A sorting domain-containing protein [Chitinophagaceae bacterium]
MKKIAAILTFTLGTFLCSHAQMVSNLFTPKASFSKNFDNIATASQALTLNSGRLSSLRAEAAPTLQLDLPFEAADMVLDLEKVTVTSPEFRVTEKRPDGSEKTVTYNDGVFYRGKIRGRNSSMATISLIGGQVMGIISDEKSNIILGAIENNGLATDEYTLYRESNLKVKNPASCFASEEMIGELPAPGTGKETQTGEPIEIYFECDYRMYQDRGSNVTNVVNFVLGFFNNVAAIYEAEDIKVQVSQITVWTTQDPEAAANLNNTSTVLSSFEQRMLVSDYIGDYAHFLSRRSLGGGIAYVLGNPCASNITRRYKTGVSGIDNSYNSFPTYSWTVEVVSHELGHNFGSNHTQWCGWAGGALDNCYATEASPSGAAACPPGPAPVNGGTIMSYCHLTGYGINFANGFGVQPGNRIRQVIGGASCFGACRMTIAIEKVNASCNQANGTATVVATASTGALTYLWSNGQTGATLVNAAPGTYHVTVKDAAGCQVMEDVVIDNSGNNLSFDLNPGPDAGFCAGGGVVLQATSNSAYSYVWSRNGTTIPGETSSSYTASQAGTFAVRASQGACTGTRSVNVTQVAAPTATITASGPTNVCEGVALTLDAGIGSPYTYQWLRNGTEITGAASSTFAPASTGNYTVRVSAGTTCSATSAATSVTITPLPVVNLSAASATRFCSGENVILSTTADAAYTYRWTRDGNLISGASTASYTASVSGVYRVAVTRGSCSVTSAQITVTVLPIPDVRIQPADTTILKFRNVTLSLSGAASYNFAAQPYFIGATATTVTVAPPSTTTFTVRGTDANGCTDDAVSIVNVIGCGDVTGITTQLLSPSRVLVSWTNPQDVTTDTLQYRKVGETTWTKVLVTGTSYEVNGLDPSSNYEYNVIPLCASTSTFVASATQAVVTPVLNNGLYVRLFPNPVINTSRLEIISSASYTLSVALYDHSGKLVGYPVSGGSYPAGQTIRSIDGSVLAAGIYHLAIRVNGKLESIKMMVAH